MKIDNAVARNMVPDRLDTAEQGSSTSFLQGAGNGASTTDLIMLGVRNQLVDIAMSGSAPEDYEVRLAGLKRLVMSGNYQPDAGRISDAIIQEALDQS